jgi:ABC-type uncharacterized transport system involved in gliding motility auxiliary subunit
LVVGTRESKIEEISEEKLTNALIKLLKDKSPTLCTLTGHGEKSFDSGEPDGFQVVKKALTDQSYEVKDLNLLQEGKIPEMCDALAIIGPTKGYSEEEAKHIQTYLAAGGRAVVALDVDLKGGEYAPQIHALLKRWYIEPGANLIIDPISKQFGAEPTAALVMNYSRDHAISRGFQENSLIPLARTLSLMPDAPAELHVQWLAQTTPRTFVITDFQQLAKGEVRIDPAKVKSGPFNVAVTLEGKLKDAKATRNTRLVVFAASTFATNNAARFGGNLDFFMNSVSWIMEDESMISIRAKEEGPGKVELSQKTGTFVFFLTVIILPLFTAVSGLVIWLVRRRM